MRHGSRVRDERETTKQQKNKTKDGRKWEEERKTTSYDWLTRWLIKS